MALFELALAVVLHHEGGFANDPDDAGGATMQGITQGTLGTYLGRPASIDEVKHISAETVAGIYRKMYWGVIRGDSITSQDIATDLLDMAVLMGPAQAIKLAQSAVGASTDGMMGPKTLAALNATPQPTFSNRFYRACVQTFVAITVRKPSQLKFLPGWITRVDTLTTKVA